MPTLHRLAICSLLFWAALGCGTSSSGGGGAGAAGGAGGSQGAPPVVVTADWLNQSLSVLDYTKLTDGQSDAASAVLDTIDLSDWEPGPIEVVLTPDGKTAVVSVGPAFFDGMSGLVGNPEIPGGGTLLIVDLDSGMVDEVKTEDVPLGIAISPDGATAYTANYGTGDARGDSLSIIDIPGRRIIEEVQVGSGPEQVALSPDGSLGIINVVSGGGVRIFETSDVAGTMSALLETGSDPSDVTFLGGNERAVVANSLAFNLTLIDTRDPSSPTVLGSTAIGVGIPYGVTYLPSRERVLATSSTTGPGMPTNLVPLAIGDASLTASDPIRLAGENFPLTAAVDSEGEFAFVAHIVDHRLSIIDLDSSEVRSIEWLEEPGPSYVAVQP